MISEGSSLHRKKRWKMKCFGNQTSRKGTEAAVCKLVWSVGKDWNFEGHRNSNTIPKVHIPPTLKY